MPDLKWWSVLWPDPSKVLSDTGLRSGDEAVDLCSGDGWFTVPMARLARTVVAIDIDRTLLESAGRRLNEHSLRNVVLAEVDAYELGSVVQSQADYVLLANAFHGVPDKPRLAKAVHSILKPGGLFAVVNWHKLPRETTMILDVPRGPPTELRVSPDETIEEVCGDGFVHVFTVEVSPHHYGAVFRR